MSGVSNTRISSETASTQPTTSKKIFRMASRRGDSDDEVDRGLAGLFDSQLSLGCSLSRALADLKEPKKGDIAHGARRIGHGLAQRSFPRYRFQERGSLFSYLVTHVSDADCQLFKSDGAVSEKEWRRLLGDVASREMTHRSSIRWTSAGGESVEEPWDDEDALFRIMEEEELVTVVATGVAKFSRWLLPIDIALSTDVTSEPTASRVQKIVAKLKEGDYAKVLQKLRALLKPYKDLRDKLARRVNEQIGRIRFLVKQLHMLVEMRLAASIGEVACANYVRNTLGLNWFAPRMLDPLLAAEELELQRRAKVILDAHFDAITCNGRRFKDLVDAYATLPRATRRGNYSAGTRK